jgi:hypothetical protein
MSERWLQEDFDTEENGWKSESAILDQRRNWTYAANLLKKKDLQIAQSWTLSSERGITRILGAVLDEINFLLLCYI